MYLISVFYVMVKGFEAAGCMRLLFTLYVCAKVIHLRGNQTLAVQNVIQPLFTQTDRQCS